LNDKIKADEIIENLEEQGEQKFFELLIESLKEDYNETIIENVVKNLNIVIKRKIEHNFKTVFPENNTQQNFNSVKSEKLPIEFVPEDKEKFKELFLEIGKAIIETHYTNGKIEEKIWTKENFSEKSTLSGNVRSRPEARKNKWKELGIVKVVYKIE